MRRGFLSILALVLPLSCSRQDQVVPAPIRFADLPQLEAELAQHRGQALLLNFWAIWCAPCVAELPELNEVARTFAGRGAAVLGVSYDLMLAGATREELLPRMRSFVDSRGLSIPVLIYDAADFDAINARFDLPGEVPITLALDREGRIVDRQEGRADEARFTEMIEKALGR